MLRVRRQPDGTVSGRVVTPAGFMTAAGPLSARYPGAHPGPVRGQALPEPTVRHPPAWRSALGARRYHDLWFAAGAWDRRVTFAPLDGAAGTGGCTVLDEAGGGGATITTDGSVLGCGPEAARYADEALALRDRWIRGGYAGGHRLADRADPDRRPGRADLGTPVVDPRRLTAPGGSPGRCRGGRRSTAVPPACTPAKALAPARPPGQAAGSRPGRGSGGWPAA